MTSANDPTLKPCPVCGQPGRRDRPDLRVLDATCTACGWHYTSSLDLSANPTSLLTQLAKDAARSAWNRDGDKVPSYPALDVWLALMAKLRSEGKAQLLTPDGHRVFVAAFQDELKALIAGRGDPVKPSLIDLSAELAELGKQAARDAWVEYARQLDQIPSYPELNAWRKLGADLCLLESDRVLNDNERRIFTHAYRNELQVLDAGEHKGRGKRRR